ncbi:hypothetical protein [Polyangium aurulentum]|uniref:bpX5 domain-containing protein n=1 Tax=Polyangium aurulentum TaxID=2567896 RepID=UPI0010AE3D98|nr:hypothetical protein [Polyangium aurulentum]UQA57502.1 hypothetical protein E8A73_040495 [Polyangium aurulentum]
MSGVAVGWTPREEPLAPLAAAAWGAASRAMAERLLDLPDATLARLSGVGGAGVIVVLGEAADLPWVDGVSYLGRDAEAPSLLLPTNARPSVPAALFARALARRFPKIAPPFAVLAPEARVVSCAGALSLSRGRIERWRGGAP